MLNNPNPRQSNNTPVRSLINIVISVGVIFGSSLASGFLQTAFNLQAPKQPQPKPRFGLAEYVQLKIGMSPTDARSILYAGTEVRSSETMITIVWTNDADDSKITAIFEHNKLLSKEQSGLK